MTDSRRLPAPPALARLAFAGFLGVYGARCLARPGEYRLLDNVDLAIHETGHLVFAPFGEFVAALGGTLFQLIVPLAFLVAFLRRGDRFAASVVLWWVAQNLWNISVYVRDARAQELPLVGGGEHDWAYLLAELDLLARDQEIGRLVHLAGTLVYAASMAAGIAFAAPRSGAPEASPSPA